MSSVTNGRRNSILTCHGGQLASPRARNAPRTKTAAMMGVYHFKVPRPRRTPTDDGRIHEPRVEIEATRTALTCINRSDSSMDAFAHAL